MPGMNRRRPARLQHRPVVLAQQASGVTCFRGVGEMTTADRLKWLQAEIDKLVERYHDESTRFKREAFQLRIVSVILAAFITVLLGLKFKNAELTTWFSNIALILGAAISVLSA